MAAFFTQIQTPARAKQVYMLGVQDDPKITLATLKDAGMLDGSWPERRRSWTARSCGPARA